MENGSNRKNIIFSTPNGYGITTPNESENINSNNYSHKGNMKLLQDPGKISCETDTLLPHDKNSSTKKAHNTDHDVEAANTKSAGGLGLGGGEDEEEEEAASWGEDDEDVVFGNVKLAFQDHLEEAMEGDDFFLTMSLTKNLSLLPSKPELTQAVEEVQQELGALILGGRNLNDDDDSQTSTITDEDDLLLVEAMDDDDDDWDPNTPPPLKAYLILGSAVCALSSIGPCLAKQMDCDACMKIVWRFQGTVVLLSPLALHSIVKDGFPKLSWSQWLTFGMAAASYSVLCVAFAMAVDYTTVSNALILTNSQSVLLVVAKLVVGQQVIFLEGMGVAIAFLGGVLAAREAAQAEDSPAQGWWSVWGDVLGIISSIGGIGYIVLGKSLRAHFPVLLFMVLNMLTASFICIGWMYVLGKEVTWDMDYNHGVFGWMLPVFQRLPLEIITVVVCNVCGTLGYVRAFKYFSSVIIAVAALLEPVVGAFTATAWNVGVLPGVEGWIGNFLVIVGTLAVLYPTTPQYQAEQLRKQQLLEAIQTSEWSTTATPGQHRRSPFPRMRTPRLQQHSTPRKRRHLAEGTTNTLLSPAPVTCPWNKGDDAKSRRLQNLKSAAWGMQRQHSS